LRNLIYLHSTNGVGYKIHLLTDKNISDYIEDIPHYFSNLCPAHQADFVRVNVICKYGGIWLDSDTIVVNSLDSLFDFIESKNGFFIKENNETLSNGIFGSRPNTSLMIEWKKQMRNLLDIKLGIIDWCDIGKDMLQDIYHKNADLYDNYHIFNGLDNLYPVNWDNCVTEFIDKPYDNYKNIIREYQPLVVLVNSVYKQLEDKTANEILECNMPLNYFINKSFGNKYFEDKYFENKCISKNNLYTNQKIYNYGKDDYISNSIICFKCWEPNISNIFDNIITNNYNHQSVVLDIGCNIGYYSLISANHTHVSKIYSIDGNIDNIKLLRMSCLLNQINNIQSINMCVSDKSGLSYTKSNAELVEKYGNIGGLSFSKTTDNIISTTTDTIISTTIDEIIKINNIIDVIIMKIDIEGGELNALKGATNSLKTNIIKNIIIEISPKFNNDSAEILEILKDNNYDIFNIPHLETGLYNNNNNYVNDICKYPIIDIDNFLKEINIQTNVIAIKKSKYVIYTDWIESYLTKEHFTFVKNLEIFGWEIIKLSKINIEKIKNTKSIVLCVTYDDFDVSLIKCDNVQIIYKIDDLYPYKEIRNKCIENADTIISPYQYLFNTDEIKKMYKNINLPNTFHIPYSAVDDFFKDIEFNNNPINKIFLSGAIRDCYPLRLFISSNIAFKDYTECLAHPSYNNYKHDCINNTYYKKLNEYLCGFVDASSYKYVLLKVFEICSVGSLLLVEDTIENQLNDLGFYDNINCIFCNKNNLENKIKWILNEENRHLINNMRKNGMELVRQKHTTTNRSETFDKYIKSNGFKKKLRGYL